ncbi:MAG: DHH family phosphoesterase [Thaumarchaeota archaeon]|jgi:RecJ-like exonuclease|nr:DHH family phosphoesterase [Nitrososphaerota archaeon]
MRHLFILRGFKVRWRMGQIILAHGDCDGVCAASIVLAARRDAKVVFTNPAGLLSELKSIEAGSIIILDVALTSKHKNEIISEFKRLSLKNEVIYLDHHPLPQGLNVNKLPVRTLKGVRGACASELAYTCFKNDLEPEMSRVAIYGAIGDYSDNTPGVRRLLEKWDKRELYLEAGILVAALEGVRRMDFDFKRSLVNYLSENKLPSADRNLVEMALREAERDEEMRRVVKSLVKTHGNVSYVVNVEWSLGKAATYARAYGETIIGVAADEHGEKIDLSIRSIGLRNLHRITSSVAEALGGLGGGHANAAGAMIPRGKLLDFVEMLNEKLA